MAFTDGPRPRVAALGGLLRRLDAFLLAILLIVAVATAAPVRGGAAAALSFVSQLCIGLLFFLYGARLPARTALTGMRNWRLHLTVLAATFVLFPVLGYSLRVLEPAVLSPSLYVGILFLSVLPSTVQTSIAFTSMARGNVAAAICAASFSNVLGVIATPLLAGLLIGSRTAISGLAFLRIAGQLLLPFLLGQVARRWIGGVLERHPRAVSRYDRGTVLLVVYSAFSAGAVAGVWHQVTPARLVVLLVVDAAFLALVLLITAGVSKQLGFPLEDRIVVVLCGSKKSIAAGIPMASVLFAHSEVSLIVLPAMLFHQLQLMVGATIARRWGRRPDAALPAEADQPVRRLASVGSPFVPHTDQIGGFVLDVGTGNLDEVV
jgi:sodium/bile acid cotransporter 7